MSPEQWEEMMLQKPVAASITAQDKEHEQGDKDFKQAVVFPFYQNCCCERCKIIRIKKRREPRLSYFERHQNN